MKSDGGYVAGRMRPVRKRRGLAPICWASASALFFLCGMAVLFFGFRGEFSRLASKVRYQELRERVLGDMGHSADGDGLFDPGAHAVDWDVMSYVNQDCVGWVSVPGTYIDYPVCLSPDASYYESHDVYRNADPLGCIFMPPGTSGDLSDMHMVLYGNGTEEGQMFGALPLFVSKEYRDSHPYVYLYGRDGSYTKWLCFSAYWADGTDAVCQPGPAAGGDEGYGLLLDSMAGSSCWECGVSPWVTDRVLTLSACGGHGDTQGRFVAHFMEVGTE